MTKKSLPKKIHINVTQRDINDGNCGDPNKCMIKIAVARAINVPHGYIKVDATGVSITRRTDYREKAFLPRIALRNMLRFDQSPETVTPFSFSLEFHKTTKVHKVTALQRENKTNRRRQRIEENGPEKKYGRAKRISGVSMGKAFLQELGIESPLQSLQGS